MRLAKQANKTTRLLTVEKVKERHFAASLSSHAMIHTENHWLRTGVCITEKGDLKRAQVGGMWAEKTAGLVETKAWVMAWGPRK